MDKNIQSQTWNKLPQFIQNQKIELNLLGDLIIAMDGVHGVDGIDKKDRSGRILLKDGKHGESGTDARSDHGLRIAAGPGA